MALAPPQRRKELVAPRPERAPAGPRAAAAVDDAEASVVLPSWRKLARPGGAVPARGATAIAPQEERAPDEETKSAAASARASGAAEGTTRAARPATSTRPAAPAAPTRPAPGRPPALRRARGPLIAPGPALDAAARSAGRPLPAEVVDAFAALWDEDFSAVVVHTDAAAAEAARLLGADAFALGEHLYFGAGRFAPGFRQGAALLAHELAHVVQLRLGDLAGVRGVSDPASRVESAADAFVARHGVPDLEAAEREGRAEAAEAGPDGGEERGAEADHEDRGKASTGAIAARSRARPAATAPVLRRATDGAKTFFSQGYFQQASGWSSATTSLDAELATDAADAAEAFPDPSASLGPEQAPERPAVAPSPPLALTGEIPVPEEAGPVGGVDGEGGASLAEAPALPRLGRLSTGADGDTSAARAQLNGALEDIPTEFDVQTSPGEPPPVALDGSADPAQTEDQEAAAHDQAEALRAQAAQAVDAGPGPEQVQPGSYHETHDVPAQEAGSLDALEEIPEMAELTAAPIPEDVRAETDTAGQAQLQATMAETNAALDAAASDHDAQREREIENAQSEQDRLNEEATRAQDQEVARARGEIDDHRADARAQQDAAVADLDEQAAEERARVQGDIDARVEQDDRSIEQEYAQAERDAAAEKDRQEAQARAEKERAERESADQSWWESALDAIASFFDALLDVVNAIFDALVEAVGAIIDAAKAAVTAIIDAARDFAVSLVRAFGELLKTLVAELLGSVFPELAAALTELIDAAVEAAVAAINWIADRLKAGLLALLDAIGAALTALLEAYRAAINAALAIARAALTGDWAALARMVLEAALNLAGIPPESFYAVINNAMAALDTILADPGAFVGNVINAVSQGFSSFADNFLQHLQEGFFTWITGPLGELGLTLPATWDLAGIFSLVLQVLGLTREGIRQVITEELGETAGAIFDFIWRYVDALITGGLEGLWNEIQNDLGMLWDTVVDGIKSWLLETIVRQAVIRIATMFNPVGALLNALVTVWNVYQWLRENARRIFGIVRAIVDMIGSIAAGNLQPAATAVENALASLVPIAISLLANLLGIGGITDKVREVLESVRGSVRNAIRSLIRRVRGLFRGGARPGGAEQPAGGDTELGEHLPVRGGGESHTVSIERNGADAVLTIATTPTPAEEWLRNLTARAPWSNFAQDQEFGRKRDAALALAAQVNSQADQIARQLASQASSTTPVPVNDDAVEATERRFAAAVSELLSYAGGVDPLTAYATNLQAMPPGSGAYAREQLSELPQNLRTPDWGLARDWLGTRTGFTSFMGENSRVGRDDTVPIVRDKVQVRLTEIANGPAPREDIAEVVDRSKPKIQRGDAPYGAAKTSFQRFIFEAAQRGAAVDAVHAAYSGPNDDLAFVTNTLRPDDQALIDQYDAAVLPLVQRREIRGNAIGLRNQFSGLLRSTNGLKYVFASGFRLQMQRIIAAAAVRPTRLHGVEVSIENRRADYTEWLDSELITVVEVKNWNGQDRWTPEERAERIQEMVGQVQDHLRALRSGTGPDAAPIGGVRVEIRGGIPPEVMARKPALEAFAASQPTVIPGRSKRFEVISL